MVCWSGTGCIAEPRGAFLPGLAHPQRSYHVRRVISALAPRPIVSCSVRYQTFRSVSDADDFVLCPPRRRFYQRVPDTVRRLGPWQGTRRGAVDALKPEHRLALARATEVVPSLRRAGVGHFRTIGPHEARAGAETDCRSRSSGPRLRGLGGTSIPLARDPARRRSVSSASSVITTDQIVTATSTWRRVSRARWNDSARIRFASPRRNFEPNPAYRPGTLYRKQPGRWSVITQFTLFAPLSRPKTFRPSSGALLRPGPYRLDQLPLYGDGFLLRHEVWRLKRNKLVYRWRPTVRPRDRHCVGVGSTG